MLGKNKKSKEINIFENVPKISDLLIPDELQEKLNLKKNKVLIGDAIEDKKMVPEEQWNETILVGFLNENIKNNLEKYKNSFDITLTKNDASFENLENCLNLKEK